MAVAHGITINDTQSPGSPNVKTTANVIPFIMGCAPGATPDSCTKVVTKVSTFQEYKDIFGWLGADNDTPDTDYNLEVFAYLFFRKFKNSPVIIKNIYTIADFVGGVTSVTAADFTALVDCIDESFVKFGIVPAHFLCPNYSCDSALRTAMFGKIDYQNSTYKTICIIDGDETDDVAAAIVDVTAITTDNAIFAYPKYATFAMSSIVCCTAVMAARENSDIPNHSPSNYNSPDLGGTIPVSLNSADKDIDLDDAILLADAGCITRVSRGTDGYQVWNSWMASFDSGGVSDYLNDTYIPRAMANYIRNLVVTNLIKDVDQPINKNQVNSVITKLNLVGGAIQGLGGLIGFKILFLEEDNADTSLAVGKTKFRMVYLAPRENSEIEVDLEIDFDYFSEIFG